MVKCNPDGTFPAPKPRRVKKDELDLAQCIIHNDRGNEKAFSNDLWALHLRIKKDDGIQILKMLYKEKILVVDLGSEKEILDAWEKIDEMVECSSSYTRRDDEFSRFIQPMIDNKYK
jgi:hypothetical protein